jgi:hypothetical protein
MQESIGKIAAIAGKGSKQQACRALNPRRRVINAGSNK